MQPFADKLFLNFGQFFSQQSIFREGLAKYHILFVLCFTQRLNCFGNWVEHCVFYPSQM